MAFLADRLLPMPAISIMAAVSSASSAASLTATTLSAPSGFISEMKGYGYMYSSSASSEIS